MPVLRISDNTIEKLRTIAEEEDKTVREVVKELVQGYFKGRKF